MINVCDEAPQPDRAMRQQELRNKNVQRHVSMNHDKDAGRRGRQQYDLRMREEE
jgi:hypothetical protein